jgi:hypothetical protein
MELKISELDNEPLLDNSAKKINVVKKRVSYDDILAKMGMYVDNGKLHLTGSGSGSCEPSTSSSCGPSKIKCARLQQHLAQPPPLQNVQGSYIYNKYFKDQEKPVQQVLIPNTPEEYKQMLIKKILERKIQQQRVRQIKSTKLIMPTENIHIAQEPRIQNRFFRF